MYCKISRFLLFLLLFTIANAFAGELNTDLWASKTGWQTKGSTLSAVSTEISTLGLKRNLRAENIEFRAKITPCKTIANGKNYKYAGIRLQEKADKFWQLALSEGPNIGNETGKQSIGLHEKFGNVWGAENKYKFKRVAYQSGTWKYGETYEFILRMNQEMVEGIVTDASGKQIAHIAYRIQEKFALKASPVLVIKRMQAGFGTLSCKIQDAKDTSQLFSFDFAAKLKEWTVRKGASFECSPWPDNTPGTCGKLVLKKYTKNSKERWPGIFLHFKPTQSWILYDKMSFDVYLPKETRFYVAFYSFKTRTVASIKYSLKAGFHHLDIPAQKLASQGFDLNAVEKVHIGRKEPPEDMTIYFGDITMTRRNNENLKKQLNKMIAEIEQINVKKSSFGNSYLFNSELQKALRTANNLSSKKIDAISPDELNKFKTAIYKCKQKYQHAVILNLISIAPPASTAIVVWANPLEKIHRTKQYFVDMPRKEAVIDAARGEGESIQLAIYPKTDIKYASVRLSKSPVTADGTLFPKSAITVAPVGYVWCDQPKYKVERTGYWPDPILTYAKQIFLKARHWQSWWMDINVPLNQKPGIYSGELSFRGSKLKTLNIPFKIKVRNFKLDPGPPYPMTVSITSDARPGRGLLIDDGLPVSPEKERKWRFSIYDMLLMNRVKPDSLYNGAISTGPLSVEDVKYRIDHNAQSFNICSTFIYPGPVMKVLPDAVSKYGKAGLMKYAYLYGFDERPEKEFSQIRKCVRTIKNKYPSIPIVTTACDYSYGTKSGLNEVDIWVPTTKRFEKDIELIRKVQKSGKRVWWYIACGPYKPYAGFLIESPLTDARLLMGLMFWKYRSDGFLYYSSTNWTDWKVVNAIGRPTRRKYPIAGAPITNWNGESHHDHNGDGVLVYPSANGPIPSIRLKAIRDGLDDYIYLRLLSEALDNVKAKRASIPDGWEKAASLELNISSKVVKNLKVYTENPAVIFAKRARIADLLEAYFSNPKNPEVKVPPYNIRTSIWEK